MKGAGGLCLSTPLVKSKMTGQIISLRSMRGLEGWNLRAWDRLSLPLLTTRSHLVNGRVKIDLNFLPKRKSRQGQFPGELGWMEQNGN